MKYITIAIILLFVVGACLCQRKKEKWMMKINPKKEQLHFLYPLAYALISFAPFHKMRSKQNKIYYQLQLLEEKDTREYQYSLYLCRKLSYILFTFFMFLILSLFGQFMKEDSVKKSQTIIRPEFGEGQKNMDLNVIASHEDGSAQWSGTLNYIIEERYYTQEELDKLIENGIAYIEQKVLGNNRDLLYITEDLVFINQLPGTSIQIQWRPEDGDLITWEGKVKNDGIDSKGVKTYIIIKFAYNLQRIEHRIELCIYPKPKTETEVLEQKIKEAIKNQSEENKHQEYIPLPEKIQGYTLLWYQKAQDIGSILIVMGVLLGILIWFYFDKEIDRKVEKRKEQLLLDYPEIISKFTLLIDAGMTTKQAWFKIVDDYEKRKKDSLKGKRYAYEEMRYTAHELKLGVSEGQAYEQFGRRAGILPYMKFSTLVTQNVKKGSKGLSNLLRREAIEAYGERKELTKQLGEEAGTKLLIPMMLLLMMVLIIIVVPAFISMGI